MHTPAAAASLASTRRPRAQQKHKRCLPLPSKTCQQSNHAPLGALVPLLLLLLTQSSHWGGTRGLIVRRLVAAGCAKALLPSLLLGLSGRRRAGRQLLSSCGQGRAVHGWAVPCGGTVLAQPCSQQCLPAVASQNEVFTRCPPLSRQIQRPCSPQTPPCSWAPRCQTALPAASSSGPPAQMAAAGRHNALSMQEQLSIHSIERAAARYWLGLPRHSQQNGCCSLPKP